DLQDRLIVSAHTQSLTRPTISPRAPLSLRPWTEGGGGVSWRMVIPPVLFLVALVGYPFVYGIWLSLEDRPVARAGVFIGVDNFIRDYHDPGLWHGARN